MAGVRISPPGPARTDRMGTGSAHVLVAVVVPVGLVLLAAGLGWLIDLLWPTGGWPVDPAVFGWLVIGPLLLSSPIVAGYLWRPLSHRQTQTVSMTVTAIIGAAAGLLFWQWIGKPFDCGFGTVTPAVEYLPQTVVVGLATGGGVALSGLLGAQLTRVHVHWWWIVAVVGASEIVLLGLTSFMGFAALGGHVCYVAGPNYPVTP